jgi:hypothetical protein
MVTIDEAGDMLDEIAEGLPGEFFRELNGGILLLPEEKLHPEDRDADLYTLGEYHCDSSMGKYIILYYGSFARIYGHLNPARFREKLKDTLLHEMTHHLEFLAGERGLEIKDEMEMAQYRQKYKKKK